MTDDFRRIAPDDSRERRSLRLEHWAAVADAANLARKATALADRYDAMPDRGDAGASRRRESVVRLRDTAASAQVLITSLIGPLPPKSIRREPAQWSGAGRDEPADTRDVAAASRDLAAEARDLRASTRDRQARRGNDDLDSGAAARFLSACDRDDAAGDRALAIEDRLAARDDRVQAEGRIPPPTSLVRATPPTLFERLDAGHTFHQAQGMLMVRSGMSASEAFEALLLAATQLGAPLPQTAVQVVQEGEWPVPVHTPLPLAEAHRGSTP